MTAKHWMWALLFLCVFSSCQSDLVTQEPVYREQPLQIQYVQATYQDGPCPADENRDCVTVRLHYPETEGGSPALGESVQAYVHSYLLQAFEGVMPARPAQFSIDSAVTSLFADYRSHRQEFPDIDFPWVIDIEGEAAYLSDRLLTLRMRHREYVGHGYPREWVHYHMFDRQTGRSLQLEDLVLDQAAFHRMAQQYGAASSQAQLSEVALLAEGLFCVYAQTTEENSFLIPMEAIAGLLR